jgi:tRNA (adenine57-N1/adenine58-N1)-methyltransferase
MEPPKIAPCPVRGLALLGETIVLARFIANAEGLESNLFASAVGKSGTLAGPYCHGDVLGRPYGSRVPSRESVGPLSHKPAYALRLTPELWTLSLPHRTQILFAADIAMVVSRLALRPGSVVVESGTGSGSLTHSLARAVTPGGMVHTFEFNASRAAQAKEEILAHGLSSVVRVAHRDVVAGGFLLQGAGQETLGVTPRGATAAFLDLPNPWEAVAHARASLAPGGVLCSFSPCIEQVQRACAAMAAEGFEDIRTFETLLRPWEFEDLGPAPPDCGSGGSGSPSTSGSGGASPPPFAALPSLSTSVSLQPLARARGHTGYLTFAHLYK